MLERNSPAPFAADKTDYQDKPFPHLVVDDLLPARWFDQILKSWPGEHMFPVRVGEDRRQISLLDRGARRDPPHTKSDFWDSFVTGAVPYIIREAMAWFGRPLFEDMKAGEGELIVTMTDLIQSFEPFSGIPAHTHYHSPLLLGTCIIYVDDAGETTRGTNILEFGPGHDDEDTAVDLALGHAEPRQLDDIFTVANSVAFKPNRGLVLMDGPLCWHGAAASPLPPGPRRQIIINWALEESWAVRRHGVSIDQFNEERVLNPTSTAVRERVVSDIHLQRAEGRYSLDAARALFQAVPVTIPGR